MRELPVDSLKPALQAALALGERRLVVSAPTGSGKSTRLPVMLLESLGGRVLVLQPRRVAARMLAKGVSSIFGMGDSVGWHVRFDKHYGDDTKIVFLTEGILARMLLSDPELRGVSAVVFDEFHERNHLRRRVACARAENAEKPAPRLGDSGLLGVYGFGRDFRVFGRRGKIRVRRAAFPRRDRIRAAEGQGLQNLGLRRPRVRQACGGGSPTAVFLFSCRGFTR